MEFKNLKDLMRKFSDEETCRTYMEQRFFPNGKPECPFCMYSEKIYRIENGKRYKCKRCQKKFSITVGTIFENSNIELSTWFGAIYLITSHKKGISSIQLGKDLGVTQKTAWFMLHRIREMMKDKAPEKLGNTVEIDESYIGGKEKNKHHSKKRKNYVATDRLKYENTKTPVLGIVERGGKVYAKKVHSAQIEHLIPEIENKVDTSAVIMTDDHLTYGRLDENYQHFVINHSLGHYVSGKVHTNTIEGFWSLLKRGIVGIYHNVTYKHLNAYCGEFAFRYNTRTLSEQCRFDLGLKQSVARRIKFKDLTSKYFMEK